METEIYSSKIRSAVVRNHTPFHSSGPKIITLEDRSNKVKVVKSENNTQILLPEKGHEVNIIKNDKWKHDLFNEESAYYYSAFIRNLSNLMTESKLNEIYSKFGVIMAIKVVCVYLGG